MSNPPHRMAWDATTPPSEMTAVSVVPPPTSTTMLPTGSWMSSPAPMAAAIGCSMRWAAEAPARRAASFTALRSTEVMADGTQMSTRGRVQLGDARPAQKEPDHSFGDVEVGDGPLAQGSDGHDVAGRSPDHLPRLVPHRQDVVGPGVEGDDGRLIQHDPPALGIDKGIGRPEIDREVSSHRLIVGPPCPRAAGAR